MRPLSSRPRTFAVMPTFERVYSPEQREALTAAYIDRGIRPQRRVIELAKAGQLPYEGRWLDPFDVNPHTLRDIIQRERKRRRGQLMSEAAKTPHGDAIEVLRQRLVALADSEMQVMERKRAGTRDPERLRQIARVVREVAALPAKGEGRALAPGQSANGAKQGSETTGGLAGSLLAAHRRATAPERPVQTHTQAENAAQRNAASETEDETDALPGAPERALLRPIVG